MNVSIIICTRNHADSLARTLESLARTQIPSEWRVELLVVDNGSNDETQKRVKGAQIRNMSLRYLFEPLPGQCHARNRGLREAKGEVILFTDDDVRVPVHWVRAMGGPLIRGEADILAGQVKLTRSLVRDWQDSVLRSWFVSGTPPPGDLWGANMAFHRRVLEVVPGFDLQLGPGALGFGDDSLFAMQLKKAGFRMAAAPVVIEHFPDPVRLEEPELLKAAAKRGKSAAYIAYHWEQRNERFVWLRRFYLSLKRILRLLLPAHPSPHPRRWLVFYIWHINYLAHFQEVRRSRQLYSRHGLRKQTSPQR